MSPEFRITIVEPTSRLDNTGLPYLIDDDDLVDYSDRFTWDSPGSEESPLPHAAD